MFNRSSRIHGFERIPVALLAPTALGIVLAMASCGTRTSDHNSAGHSPQTVTIPVDGMSCVSCAARVTRALKRVEGVQEVQVSLERREAVVQFWPDRVSPDHLRSAINALGYKAGLPRMTEEK